MRRYILPLAIFLVLVGFLAAGLRLKPREVPSPLIGQPAPAFSVPQLHDAQTLVSPSDMKGKVWLFNVWASWCVSCRQEHPILMDLSRRSTLPIIGLNYKDERAAGIDWLRQHGDPYLMSVHDRNGRVGIDYGVYGVPESFLIDKHGTIRYKHIGPLTQKVIDETILPLAKELNDA